MASDFDIIITSPDSTDVRLVAETKLDLHDRREAEEQFKRAMLRVAAPVGLLVTPEKLWIYLDSYTSREPDSVRLKGEFDVRHLLMFKPKQHGRESEKIFQSVVQNWLHDLPANVSQESVKDKQFLQLLSTYVVPAVEAGEVRAAGPRYW